jgi:hypothetical protein
LKSRDPVSVVNNNNAPITSGMVSRESPANRRLADVSHLTPADPLVQRFNELNRTVALSIPAVAIAYDTLERVLPLLREMQALLSRRPHCASGEYKMLDRKGARVLGARFVEDKANLPSWTVWLGEFSAEIGYSVRHLRRLILNEPRRKTVKECGWSPSAHEQMLEIALKARELVRAVAVGAGGEIYRIAGELDQQLDASQELLEEDWQKDVEVGRKRKAQKVTRVEPAA